MEKIGKRQRPYHARFTFFGYGKKRENGAGNGAFIEEFEEFGETGIFNRIYRMGGQQSRAREQAEQPAIRSLTLGALLEGLFTNYVCIGE